MRKSIIILLVAGAAFWMFQHPNELRLYSGQVFRSASFFLTKYANEFAPIEEKQLDRIELEPPPPEGVYCIRQAIRFSSVAGAVTILPVGAEARKIGEGNGKLVLTDGTGQAIVDSSLVTRDPLEIQALREQHTSRTMQVASHHQTQSLGTISVLDAKISSLQAELKQALEREAFCKARGIASGMGTSPDFIRSELMRYERQRAAIGGTSDTSRSAPTDKKAR
ncbi:MAG: hypothetical protein ACOYMN_17385 [Roseimicrobium sp.]